MLVWLKTFLKPNRWKASGLLLPLLSFFVIVTAPSPTFGEIISPMPGWAFFSHLPGFIVLVLLFNDPIFSHEKILGVETVDVIVLLINLAFYYLLACLIYSIITKIKSRLTAKD